MKKHKKWLALALSVAVGLILANLPVPEGIKVEGWRLLAIFVATVVAIVGQAMPMGAITITAVALCVVTKTLPVKDALSGFSNPIIWLVALAFFISRGFILTGLGTRTAFLFMRVLGKSTLGLGYGMMATDLILAPAIPSVTARAGGVVYPILSGLSKAFGSDPESGTSRKISSFLTQVAFQGSCVTSAMFLTAMAGNPLIRQIASKQGVDLTWGLWALAALIPGLCSLIFIPLVIHKVYPPTIKHTPQAKELAIKKLREMGKMSLKESIMLGVFALLVILWAGESTFKIPAVAAALLGLSILLITGVLSWKDVIKEEGAWDTFIWLAVLIMMASYLYEFGITNLLSSFVTSHIAGMNWAAGFAFLSTAYFFTHYFFASNMAHIGALYSPFLLLAIGVGTPPVLAALVLAFFSNLFGCLTHYGCGPAPIFFGSGNVDIRTWWKLGFIIGCLHILVWLGLGSLWWKVLALW